MNINFLSIIRSTLITATLLFTLTGNSFAMGCYDWMFDDDEEMQQLSRDQAQSLRKTVSTLWNHKNKIITAALVLLFASEIYTDYTTIPKCAPENWTFLCQGVEKFTKKLVQNFRKFETEDDSCSQGVADLSDYLTEVATAFDKCRTEGWNTEKIQAMKCIIKNCKQVYNLFAARCPQNQALYSIHLALDKFGLKVFMQTSEFYEH